MTEEHFDVVIVGGGGSGLAAAIEAAASASVVVLEKGSALRGTTGIAVGSITASRTRRQKRLNVVDSPDEHLEDYLLMAGARSYRDNPALSRLLVDNVGETVDWLEDLGVVFFGPVQEPPHRKPRMHNVLPSARSYIYYLEREARRRGVQIRLSTAAHRLDTLNGRVVAVDAVRSDSEKIRYVARKGVVLAGGDFSNDPAFREDFLGAKTVNYRAANELATGDCQKMAMELGAQICNPDLFEGAQMRFPPAPRDSLILRLPPTRAVGSLFRWGLNNLPGWLVRPFAMQYVTTYLAPDTKLLESGAMLVDQTGALIDDIRKGDPFYVVMDDALFDRFNHYPNYIATAPNVAFAYADDFRRNRPDIYFGGTNLPDLAAEMSVSPVRLAASAAKHNAAAVQKGLSPLGDGRLHALGPVQPYVLTTHGGLKVSERLEVLGPQGTPIPGLFAAGQTGRGGVLLPGHGHSLGWAFTSGRLAGRNAASEQNGD